MTHALSFYRTAFHSDLSSASSMIGLRPWSELFWVYLIKRHVMMTHLIPGDVYLDHDGGRPSVSTVKLSCAFVFDHCGVYVMLISCSSSKYHPWTLALWVSPASALTTDAEWQWPASTVYIYYLAFYCKRAPLLLCLYMYSMDLWFCFNQWTIIC